MREYPNILSSYDPDTDYEELEKLRIDGLARWNGGVDLYKTGLPFPDVMLIDDKISDKKLLNDLTEFARRCKLTGCELAHIRRDVKIEKDKLTASGAEGLVYNFSAIISEIKQAQKDGFVTSLWVRDSYRYNRMDVMTISFVKPDEIKIEMLGGGYDAGGISKGYISIPVYIQMKPHSPSLLDFEGNMEHLPFYLDIYDEAKELSPDKLAVVREERREQRIRWLAKLENQSYESYKEWLEKNSNGVLFTRECSYDFAKIKKLFGYAITYVKFKNEHNLPFKQDTFALHIAKNGRVFFDNKWDSDYAKTKG